MPKFWACQYLQMSVAGGGQSKRRQERNVQFQIQCSVTYTAFISEPVVATTISSIAQPVKPVEFNQQDYELLKNLRFTEQYPSHEELILDVLIGEPMFSHLCIGSAIVGSLSEPAAQ